MSYTISNAKTDLEGMLHSTTTNKVRNLDTILARAARTLLGKIDPPETIRISQITNAVFTEVYDYTVPSDLKGEKVIDIRPQANRSSDDSFTQRGTKQFDKLKTSDSFQIRNNSGVKSLRLSKTINISANVVLHNMDSLTANGTWAADGTTASNLTLDTLYPISGSGCLNFDVAASGSVGYVENSTFTAVNLSSFQDTGMVFVWVYIPDTSIITNWILRWGSSSSAYWSVTVTAPHDQSSFKTGWNLLAFNWNGATKTGSPDSAAIDYLRVSVTYNGTAETDLRVDKIMASNGEIYEIEYYSKFLFRTSGGTWGETITADTDIINLDTDGYNIFLFEAGTLIAQQLQGEDAVFDRNFFREELYGASGKTGLYAKYMQDHHSEAIQKQEYYQRPWLFRRSR